MQDPYIKIVQFSVIWPNSFLVFLGKTTFLCLCENSQENHHQAYLLSKFYTQIIVHVHNTGGCNAIGIVESLSKQKYINTKKFLKNLKIPK